ncbi:PREDICTED: uncharacterized protein LOC108763248 isoform X1 [Trachymyrmex cornetzi]|uniref:Uncharacterized protein n=1 Tax=Trachymyrmex cornetzi TaxID=471704 RepID=A0A151J494_9HYME|nr:PREDICTED: uncharacterized protein LOC108763248 isoform X1 [Trachymyrmex cornetzi]XP_018366212.1 PREDICTED: uncharacterized protein LOC108763248 isoform X1 [Trachymyrmex cornetzi]KYN17417.1 hypothetical protein ALC57_10289 [Trachymyrmex cornetzi]
MILPFFEEDAWCYWVVSVGALLSFLGLVATCICSCRRNENKNEFLDLAGTVTLNNSETDNFDRILTLDVCQVVEQDINDGKRTTSANRSLPDIPKDKSREHENMVDSEPQDIYDTTEIIGDHSELYATVQDAAQEQMFEREPQEVILQGCTLPQDTSHQYTRFASPVSDNLEHPYAQLQNVQKTEASQINRNNVNQITNTEKPSTSMDQSNENPIAPPRTRRSSSHNSLLNSEIHYDIQAANAISGGVQANQDLPYMTPPLLMLLPQPLHPQHNNLQQHFSGDSQDSKGYTSISVREPLANIIAQSKTTYRQNQSARPITDPHYATVSDDSDEMYAAIDEQDKIYTSGSETYAQIQPMTSEVQVQHEQIVFCQPPRTEEAHSAPQPPSVDSLRHVAHAHSRQASSSSANSSIINLGSPKPEKRQANSPLPPPPEATAEAYASIDKKNKNDDKSKSSLSAGKSLEDMYAKVMKKKKEIEEQQNDAHSSFNNVLHSETNACRKLSLIEISRASWCSHESVEIQKKESDFVHCSTNNSSTTSNFYAESNKGTPLKVPKDDADVISLHLESDHEYEAVNSNGQRNSVARIVMNSFNSNYDILRQQSSQENENNSISMKNNTDIYSTPFKRRQVSNASSDDPGYEKVRLQQRDHEIDSEPNYESMPHDTNEPNYASVCRPGDSDTDPNYESVNHTDPNYESVKYMSVGQSEEPPYEQVNNLLLDANADGYEKVKNKKKMDSNYEKIIHKSLERISNGGDTDDEQFVQV